MITEMASDKNAEVSNPPMTPLQSPSLPWRASSAVIMGLTCMVSRAFLYGFNNVETTGLQKFLSILDEREDVDARKRGLLTGAYLQSLPLGERQYAWLTRDTVCNHISVYVIHSSSGVCFETYA